jgi:uncharacterized membrane protein
MEEQNKNKQPIITTETITSSRQLIKSFKSKADSHRKWSEKVADSLTTNFGSILFLLANMIFFFVWILLNSLPNIITPFDPYPFGFLTLVVSLEAIFLAIIVLISQNRAAKITDIREEMDIQIDLITEAEITKMLHLMAAIAEKQGIDIASDKTLQRMLRPINKEYIEKTIKKQLEDF